MIAAIPRSDTIMIVSLRLLYLIVSQLLSCVPGAQGHAPPWTGVAYSPRGGPRGTIRA